MLWILNQRARPRVRDPSLHSSTGSPAIELDPRDLTCTRVNSGHLWRSSTCNSRYPLGMHGILAHNPPSWPTATLQTSSRYTRCSELIMWSSTAAMESARNSLPGKQKTHHAGGVCWSITSDYLSSCALESRCSVVPSARVVMSLMVMITTAEPG